jgi:hypothetical protein
VSAPEPEPAGDEGTQTVFYTAVRDTGIGMTPTEVSSLFVRFGQLNKCITRDYGGSGLGLNISNELVHLLGGAIHVNSEKGAGTQMRFSVSMGTVPHAEAALWRAQQRDACSSPVLTTAEKPVIPATAENTGRTPAPGPLKETAFPTTTATPALVDIRSEDTSPATSASSSPATPPPAPAKFAHVLIAEVRDRCPSIRASLTQAPARIT